MIRLATVSFAYMMEGIAKANVQFLGKASVDKRFLLMDNAISNAYIQNVVMMVGIVMSKSL